MPEKSKCAQTVMTDSLASTQFGALNKVAHKVSQLRTSLSGNGVHYENEVKALVLQIGLNFPDVEARGRTTSPSSLFDGESSFKDYLVQFDRVSQLNQWS